MEQRPFFSEPMEAMENGSPSPPSSSVLRSREPPKSANHSNNSNNNSAPQSHVVTRGGSRNQAVNRSQFLNQKSDEEPDLTTPLPKFRSLSGRSHQSREVATRGRKPKQARSRQGLRSGDKPPTKTFPENRRRPSSSVERSSSLEEEEEYGEEDEEEENSDDNEDNDEDNDTSPPRPETPTPTSPSRLTRRSSQNSPTACSSSPRKNNNCNNSSGSSLQANLLSLGASNTLSCSSASSTHSSSVSSPKLEKKHVLNHPPVSTAGNSCSSSSKMVKDKEILEKSWKIVPDQLYELVPAPPSLVYGPQHLLRLFVKLPELIYKMNIPQRKLTPLLDVLENFLAYLTEKKDEMFLHSSYIDSCEDSPSEGSAMNTN